MKLFTPKTQVILRCGQKYQTCCLHKLPCYAARFRVPPVYVLARMQEPRRLRYVVKELLQKLHQATQYQPLQQQLLTACIILLDYSNRDCRAAPSDMPVVEVCCLLSLQAC